MQAKNIDRTGALLAVIALAILPLVFESRYLIGVLTVAAIYGIWSVSWDFMSGLTGRENFGHSLFIGVGAYAAGFLNTELGANAWWSLPVGMLAAVVTGAPFPAILTSRADDDDSKYYSIVLAAALV